MAQTTQRFITTESKEPLNAYVVSYVRTSVGASSIANIYDANTNPPTERWAINNDGSVSIAMLVSGETADSAIAVAMELITGEALRDLLKSALLARYGLSS